MPLWSAILACLAPKTGMYFSTIRDILDVVHSRWLACKLPIFFKETARGLPLPLLATTSGTLACGSIPSFPLTTQVQKLCGGLNLFPSFTTNQVQCWRERTSTPLSTTLGTCLLVTQILASYSVKSLPPGWFLKRYTCIRSALIFISLTSYLITLDFSHFCVP